MGVVAGVSAVASLASVGMSAYGAIEKGKGQQAADYYQAQKAETAALYGKTAADQTDATMRENLNITLGNINAVRASANIDPSSPTTAALRDRTEVLGDRARNTKVDNILAQVTQDTSDASYLRSAGDFALSMGEVQAGADAASGIAKAGFAWDARSK